MVHVRRHRAILPCHITEWMATGWWREGGLKATLAEQMSLPGLKAGVSSTSILWPEGRGFQVGAAVVAPTAAPRV